MAKIKRMKTTEEVLEALREQPDFMPTQMILSEGDITVHSQIRDYLTDSPKVVFLLKVRSSGTEFCESTLEAVLRHWF